MERKHVDDVISTCDYLTILARADDVYLYEDVSVVLLLHTVQ